ncbi:MAG: hypothetical protein ACJA01_002248 [Saprospiraceae bacterium]|jgi:hypothetical protein
MTKKLLLIAVSALINTLYINYFDQNLASSEIYIYGTVTTHDDHEYKGQMRWGKEEIFWFDMFNSSKPENENLDYLSKGQIASLDKEDKWHGGKIDVPFVKKWNWNNNSDHSHAFSIRFGDIAKLEIRRGDRVVVHLKSGDKIKLKGGSNDIGTEIQVNDLEVGNIKLDWDQVAEVSFSSGKENVENKFGNPLYGTVTTRDGSFTGFVQWDHDERMSEDELNGEYEDGEVDIPFGSITSIERISRGSEVNLASGRTFKLYGTNDVNNDNRGIIVNIENLGRVDIPWGEFEKVVFTEAPDSGNLNYNSFSKGGEHIKGTVTSKEGTYKGLIAYDLDESYLCEMLNGQLDDIEYSILFEFIQSIASQDEDGSEIILRSGKKIYLEEVVDVSSENDGALIFSDGEDERYISWDEITKISLD